MSSHTKKIQLYLFLTGIMTIKNATDIRSVSKSGFPIHIFKGLRILQSLDQTGFLTPCGKTKNLDFLSRTFALITTAVQYATNRNLSASMSSHNRRILYLTHCLYIIEKFYYLMLLFSSIDFF